MSIRIDKFEIIEKDDKLHVYVEVPHHDHLLGIEKFELSTGTVQNELDQKKIKYGKCIKEYTIKNWRHATRKGEWIFEKLVDKSVEPVIMEEEKSVKPKKTRRTRSSTKKVSTEE